MNNVLKNIKKNAVKFLIESLIIELLMIYGLVIETKWLMIYGFVFNRLLIIPLIIVILFIGRIIIIQIELVINPLKSDIFKKYGSPEEIQSIVDEMQHTIEYEDKNLMISKRYIGDKKDYSKIVSCDDVLGAHKLIHKTNFITDYIQIIIIDKYNQKTIYTYKTKEKDKCDQILHIIEQKCKNASVGYTKEEEKNIKNNIQKL